MEQYILLNNKKNYWKEKEYENYMVIKIVICYTSSFNLDYHLIYTYHLPLDYIGLEAANLDALMLICHKKDIVFQIHFCCC